MSNRTEMKTFLHDMPNTFHSLWCMLIYSTILQVSCFVLQKISLGCIGLLNIHGKKWHLNAFYPVSSTRANPRAELVTQLNLQAVCPNSSASVAWDVIYQIIWALFSDFPLDQEKHSWNNAKIFHCIQQ